MCCGGRSRDGATVAASLQVIGSPAADGSRVAILSELSPGKYSFIGVGGRVGGWWWSGGGEGVQHHPLASYFIFSVSF